MTDRRGVALVLLIFVTLLLIMLGTALLTIAMSDFRVSWHLAEAEKAFYSAEAGVEAALAVLPPEHYELNVFSGQLTQTDEPVFNVSIEPFVEEEYAVRIQAEGRAGNKVRKVEALARYLPFGRHSVIAESLRMEQVLVKENAICKTLVIGPGETQVGGNLFSAEQLASEGDLACAGYQGSPDNPEFPQVDFAVLEEAAAGWTVPSGESGLYGFGEGAVTGCYYVPGDLLISGEAFEEALVVVSGSVEIRAMPAGSLVVLVGGEVVITDGQASEVPPDERELVVYSAVRIAAGEAGPLFFRGVMLAPVVELRDVTVAYSDRAVMPWLDFVPQELLLISPSFAVEWVDQEVRR